MITGNRFYNLVLVFIVAVLGYLTYRIVDPFLSPIMWAVVFSVVFYPFYAFILRYVRYRAVASVLTLLAIFLIIIGPFSYFAYLLTLETVSLVNRVQTAEGNLLQSFLGHPEVNTFIQKLLVILRMTEGEFYEAVTHGIINVAKASTGLIKTGFGNIVTVGINFIFIFLCTFFFLEDGPALIEKLEGFMPFSRRQRTRLLQQTKDIVVSTIYGGVVVAMSQAIIGGITFALLGIHSPMVWALAMFVSSFIPVVGTFIVWGPIVIYLFFQAQYLKGVILILVGVLAISSVDNILRPLIIKGKMKMPTVAIFFAILGGIKFFGFIGFILGPLVLALFISVFDIFRFSEEERYKTENNDQ
jgi:predicted PurR-regulated permease PerM